MTAKRCQISSGLARQAAPALSICGLIRLHHTEYVKSHDRLSACPGDVICRPGDAGSLDSSVTCSRIRLFEELYNGGPDNGGVRVKARSGKRVLAIV